MSNQRIKIIGKKKFNEKTKVIGIRVPISKYDDIKNLVNLLVNDILKGRQIRIQTQRKNGIIRDILDEIGNPNEEKIQSQEIIDLKKGFSELLTIKNKVSQHFNNSFWSLLSDENWIKILKQGDFDLISRVKKNLNNPANPNDSNLKEKIKKLYEEFDSLPKKEQYSLGSKGVEILNKIHKLEIKLEKNPKIKRIHPFRVKSDIIAIKGYLSHVPLDIAPNDDKGVYFTKAQQFVESLIKKYEKLAKKSNPNNPGNPGNSDKKMDIKTLENIENLIWKDILQEDKENFTPEFREKVRKTIEKIEIMIKTNKYTNMLESFDLLNDSDKLETWLSYLTEKEREKLYSHELLDEFDLLP